MATSNENNLNDEQNYSGTNRKDDAHADQLGENTGGSGMESENPYNKAEDPSEGKGEVSASSENSNRDEAYGENAGVMSSTDFKNSDLTPGPGDEDDEDDDDSLIPIEGDDDDDLLGDDDDDDDLMNDDDSITPIADEDDDDEDGGDINRSSISDMGSNISGRETGRTTGRMIDHEPGTAGI